LQEAILAADELTESGVSCRIVSMHTIKPIDVDEIVSACKETKGIVTIEEHTLVGGMGSAIAELCMDKGLKTNFFVRIGMQDEYSEIVGDQQYLRQNYKIDKKSIKDKVLEFV